MTEGRPPSPLPSITRKNVVKSNSMKRSTTYIPSRDMNKTTTSLLSPQRAMTMSHRRSQSATFLPKMMTQSLSLMGAKSGDEKISNFSKPKPTIFDTEVGNLLWVKSQTYLRRLVIKII